MQFNLIAATIALLATSVIADNCTPGLKYCGQTLLDKGDYQEQIDQALADSNQIEVNDGKGDLFNCIGGPSGTIKWLMLCKNGCVDAGSGNSDLYR